MSQAEDTTEALRLAAIARERLLTEEEYEIIEAIAERSQILVEDYKGGECPVLDFWTTLVKHDPNNTATNTLRDVGVKANIPRLKKKVFMEILRVLRVLEPTAKRAAAKFGNR